MRPSQDSYSRNRLRANRFVFCLCGCIAPCLLADTAAAGGQLSVNLSIYDRAHVWFTNAVLFKPAERCINEAGFALAPLILQESELREPQAELGALQHTWHGTVLDRSHPVVYYVPDTTVLNGQSLPRLAYVWFYSRHGRLAAQGVRLTLNTSGKPSLTEVLADRSGKQLLFVTSSVEERSKNQHGPPLPGRKFCVERSLQETPGTVVARVIEEGPVPMGPIVYVEKNAHDIATVICRCMPAQGSHVLRTFTYDLREWKNPTPEWLRKAVQSTRALKFLEPGNPQDSLGKVLRW
jgi:hypothetical protein